MEDRRLNHNDVPSHFGFPTNFEYAAEVPGRAGFSHQHMISWGDIQKNNRVSRFLEAYQNYRERSSMPIMPFLADQKEQAVARVPVDSPGISECIDRTKGVSKLVPGIKCSAGARAVNSNPASVIADGLIRHESNLDLRNNTMKRSLRRAANFSTEFCAEATRDAYQSDLQHARSGRIINAAFKSHSTGRVPIS